jgi:hypothetical protein
MFRLRLEWQSTIAPVLARRQLRGPEIHQVIGAVACAIVTAHDEHRVTQPPSNWLAMDILADGCKVTVLYEYPARGSRHIAHILMVQRH